MPTEDGIFRFLEYDELRHGPPFQMEAWNCLSPKVEHLCSRCKQ